MLPANQPLPRPQQHRCQKCIWDRRANHNGTCSRRLLNFILHARECSFHGTFLLGRDPFLVTMKGGPKVLLPLMEFDFFLNYYGAAIAQLSVPTLSIDSITPIINDPAGDPVRWGISAMVETAFGGPTLYVYGIEDQVPFPPFTFIRYRVPHVARVDLRLGLSGVTDMNKWQVFNLTSGWVSNNILAS